MPDTVKQAPVLEVKEALKKKLKIQIIDVREPGEFASGSIPEAINVPLSHLEKNAEGLSKEGPVYLICQSASRATQAAKKFEQMGFNQCKVMEGGINAWKGEGLDLTKGTSHVWAMERQVRFGAGVLVLSGILAAWFFHPNFIWVSLFVSLGLIYAAITDTCGMALLLAKMPWNQKK